MKDSSPGQIPRATAVRVCSVSFLFAPCYLRHIIPQSGFGVDPLSGGQPALLSPMAENGNQTRPARDRGGRGVVHGRGYRKTSLSSPSSGTFDCPTSRDYSYFLWQLFHQLGVFVTSPPLPSHTLALSVSHGNTHGTISDSPSLFSRIGEMENETNKYYSSTKHINRHLKPDFNVRSCSVSHVGIKLTRLTEAKNVRNRLPPRVTDYLSTFDVRINGIYALHLKFLGTSYQEYHTDEQKTDDRLPFGRLIPKSILWTVLSRVITQKENGQMSGYRDGFNKVLSGYIINSKIVNIKDIIAIREGIDIVLNYELVPPPANPSTAYLGVQHASRFTLYVCKISASACVCATTLSTRTRIVNRGAKHKELRPVDLEHCPLCPCHLSTLQQHMPLCPTRHLARLHNITETNWKLVIEEKLKAAIGRALIFPTPLTSNFGTVDSGVATLPGNCRSSVAYIVPRIVFSYNPY
ncbi:hypothetical protein J6590_024577 [Homalodisca vitripennis]|nr:hypothetical protein J6590_024577 [Homalodisca vitripennis]